MLISASMIAWAIFVAALLFILIAFFGCGRC